jgi:hypothetical protein
MKDRFGVVLAGRSERTLDLDDFTDNPAVAAVSRVTRGNFRILHRRFHQSGSETLNRPTHAASA